MSDRLSLLNDLVAALRLMKKGRTREFLTATAGGGTEIVFGDQIPSIGPIDMTDLYGLERDGFVSFTRTLKHGDRAGMVTDEGYARVDATAKEKGAPKEPSPAEKLDKLRSGAPNSSDAVLTMLALPGTEHPFVLAFAKLDYLLPGVPSPDLPIGRFLDEPTIGIAVCKRLDSDSVRAWHEALLASRLPQSAVADFGVAVEAASSLDVTASPWQPGWRSAFQEDVPFPMFHATRALTKELRDIAAPETVEALNTALLQLSRSITGVEGLSVRAGLRTVSRVIRDFTSPAVISVTHQLPLQLMSFALDSEPRRLVTRVRVGRVMPREHLSFTCSGGLDRTFRIDGEWTPVASDAHFEELERSFDLASTDKDVRGILWYGRNEVASRHVSPQRAWLDAPKKPTVAPVQKHAEPKAPKDEKYGKWKNARPLSGGGQGDTLLVQENGSGPDFVLKRLKNKDRIARMQREFVAGLRLRHPNIVRVVDSRLDGDPLFLVTEYCAGGTLADLSGNSLGLRRLLELFHSVTLGVAHAHANDVIHRDLKPSNIFVKSDQTPVVGDFGLCYLTDVAEEIRATAMSEAAGPRLYMAPELEDGRVENPTRQCDVYSLGKVIYFLLSGGECFSREKHRDERFDLRRRSPNPILDLLYREVLDRSIVFDPEARFPDAGAMAEAVLRIRRCLEEGTHIIGKDVPQQCSYCGEGRYRVAIEEGTSSSEVCAQFGLSNNPGTSWRILACEYCGNVQLFRADLAKDPTIWKK